MSGTFDNINKCGSFNIAEKKALVAQFRATGITGAQTAPADLTDNSTGVASDTLAAMTGVDGTGSNAAPLTATKNAVASLAAKVNAILQVLADAGVTV